MEWLLQKNLSGFVPLSKFEIEVYAKYQVKWLDTK